MLALTTACALLFALGAQAFAESRTVFVSRDGAKVYNAGGSAVAAIPRGVKLRLVGVRGGICRITYNGRAGFMKKSDLSASQPRPKDGSGYSKTVYAAKDGARLYNASGVMIGSVALNTKLACTGVKGSICRVTRSGRTAYMKKSDLSARPVVIPEVTPTPAPPAAPAASQASGSTAKRSATAYVGRDGAKVYSASGKALGSLSVNTAVSVFAVKGSACLVSIDGRTGLMKRSDLSANRVEVSSPECRTAYVNKDGAKVYTAAGKAAGSLGVNAAVSVVAVKGSVCRVSIGGRTGYMNAADLSCDKTEQSSGAVDIPDVTGYVSRDGAKVYSASGAAIATLSLNTAVTVSAMNGAVVRVVNGSASGYMAKSDISASRVPTTTIPAGYSLKRGDSGEAVKKVQRRLKELGYFAGSIGGNYQSLTQAAVKAFQAQVKLTASGVCDAHTLEAMFNDSAPKMPQTAAYTAATSAGPVSDKSTATAARGTAREMDWWTSGIQGIFSRGTTAVITDVATGLSWREQRRGGSSHADVQPLTAADTAVLKKVYGGTWSWNRRAIIVTINGVNYAASMNGMPHGSGSISGNNFNGHHCIHFTNSRTHGSDKVCPLHQAAIKKALSVTL